MRIKARHVLTSILLGVASTLAFAWAPAFFNISKESRYAKIVEPHFESTSAYYMRGFSLETLSISMGHHDLILPRKSQWWSRSKNNSLLHNLHQQAEVTGRGWPLIGLYWLNGGYKGIDAKPWSLKGGLVIPPNTVPFGHRRKTILPYYPIWPALAINIGVHNLTWLLLLFGAGSLRSFVRTSRGKCAKCAYHMKDIQQCPECGWRRKIRSQREPSRRHSS